MIQKSKHYVFSVFLFVICSNIIFAGIPPYAAWYESRRQVTDSIICVIPMSDGISLSGIVLPENPSEAEKFAAYELQKYVHQMTNITLEQKGQDTILPGRTILIGGAAGDVFSINNLPPDSYVIKCDTKNLILAGNTPRGTLYAVYDFLKTQGCGWFMPGILGEVVPTRKMLDVHHGTRTEKPSYNVRGYWLVAPRLYDINGGWADFNFDDYADWCVRNRVNTFMCGYNRTSDLGSHRGYGYNLMTNHSWARVSWDPNHPEWYALVKGDRTQLHPSGRPNSICISNPELRKSVTEKALKFFRNNPKATTFALSADDEPHYWCECLACRALDSDRGKEKWVTDERGYPAVDMADRALNFVNDIAERVSKVYPDKLIEMYAYAATRNPPKCESVHPNVLVKFTYWPGGPLNRPLLETSSEHNVKLVAQFDGWKKAGTKHFGIYDYGDFFHPDRPIFWFYHIVDSLKTFNMKWGIQHILGENDNTFNASFMYQNIRARAMWNTELDWEEEVNDICMKFYGKAGEKMRDYYMFMSDCVMKADAWKEEGYSWLQLAEYEMPQMAQGREILEEAVRRAGNDMMVEQRIAIARFGHAYMTLCVAQKRQNPSLQITKETTEAFELANNLHRQYNIKFQQGALMALKSLYLPPSVGKTLYRLPLEWRFMKDPNDIGLTNQWFKSADFVPWVSIAVDRDWTSQGHRYHGVAWYAITFQMGVEEANQKEFAENREKLAFYFGAVDGLADIYLDGVKIGEQKRDIGYMWNKSFVIPLPAKFDATVEHKLVVRVSKKAHAAGIWKPVSIISQNDGI